MRPEDPLPSRPDILNIHPLPAAGDHLVDEALKRDLSRVERLRFDPVNTCNMSCVFCGVDQTGRTALVSVDGFRRLLESIAASCRRVLIGCGHEPLMARNIGDYGIVLREAIPLFAHRPTISLTTNGLLLHKRDISPYTEFLDWLHISISSMDSETFKRIQSSDLNRVIANVMETRSRQPDLRMHTEFIVTKWNAHEAVAFVDWAFDELGFDSINVRRVDTSERHHPNSYLALAKAASEQIGLTDGEWSRVVDDVRDRWPGDLAVANALGHVPVIELSRGSRFAEVGS